MGSGSKPPTAAIPEVEALRRFVVAWRELDWPLDWDHHFQRAGSLALEIGFGNGDFLVDQASVRPDTRFVGIERGWGSIQRALKRIRASKLENVRVLQGDANLVVERLFASDSLEEVTINFPDPWPKERHHPRRLIQPGFLATLGNRMRPRGELLVATDHADLAAWIAEAIQGQDRFEPMDGTLWVHHLPGRTQTKYERKAVQAGIPIYYFRLRRRAFASTPAPSDRVGDVPNVILKGDFDPRSLMRGMGRPVWRWSYRGLPVVARVRGVYEDLEEGHRLVEVMVKEGALAQVFGISVLLRPDGGLLVKLSALGQARPTWGVKQVVARVAETICATHEGLEVASSNIPPADED